MGNTVANPMPFAAEIESVRSAISKQAGSTAGEDFRSFAEGLVQWVAQQNPNPPAPASGSSTAPATQAAPSDVSMAVTGANGAYTVQIDNGEQNGRTVYHEVSYSTTKSFSTAVTTLPVSPATHLTVNVLGQTLFFRRRSSFDQKSWSDHALSSPTAVASGLISSAAQDDGVAFNQTNYGVVSSQASGGAAVVPISGASGPNTALVRQKGPTQSTIPGGVIANVPFGTDQFVGYSAATGYQIKPTLADVLRDNLTPIGKVSVVDAGTPTLPAVTLVLGGAGGHEVIAWNVTSQGNGLSGPVTLVINTSTGAGATPGAQTIQNGKLIAVAPGNPGDLYVSADTVTVSGGVGAGTPGGGTAAGGNGGRLTAV